MKLRWSKKAQKDFFRDIAYIADDNEFAARAVYEAVNKHVSCLLDHPKLAKSGRVKNTRELVNNTFNNYIVVYMIREETIIILRVLHAREQWPKT